MLPRNLPGPFLILMENDVKDTQQPGGPQRTILIAFYERYREEMGSAELPETEAIQFGEYLLTHLEEFLTEVERYTKNFPEE